MCRVNVPDEIIPGMCRVNVPDEIIPGMCRVNYIRYHYEHCY
jgi:hypothetical protein